MRLLFKSWGMALAALLLAIPIATPASAATVMVTNVSMNAPNTVTLNGGAFNGPVYMAPVTLTLDNMSSLLAFCVDIQHAITSGAQVPPLTYNTSTLASYLSGYSSTVQQQIASLVFTGVAMPSGTNMNAVQGGIWQKLGASVTTDDAALQAQINFYGMSASLYDPGKIRVLVSQDGKQSFADAPVPEPATWAMMIGGFGGMGFVLRRRSSAARSVATA